MQVPKNDQKENSPDFPGRPVQAETALYILSVWLLSKYSFTVYNSIGIICRLNLDLAKHRKHSLKKKKRVCEDSIILINQQIQ